MSPGIAGGADLAIGRAVGVVEVERVVHAHRAVVVAGWRRAGEGAALGGELATVAVGLVGPLALELGAEADAIRSIAVVETGDGDGIAAGVVEACGELDVQEGVPAGWSVQRNLEDVPLLNCSHACVFRCAGA